MSKHILFPADPRIKPSVPVEIDWDNPLTKGLQFAVPMTEAGLPRDIVNGGIGTLNGSAIDVTVGGKGHEITTTTGSNRFNIPANLDLSGGVTLAVLVKGGTGNTGFDAPICLYSSGSTSLSLYANNSGSQFRLFATGQSDISLSGHSGVSDTEYDLAIYSDPLSTSATVNSLDGDVFSTGTGFGSGVKSNGYTSVDLAGSSAFTGEGWTGSVALAFVWGRPLTAKEHRSLANNPYQLLKPALPLAVEIAEEETAQDVIPVPKQFQFPADPRVKPSGVLEFDTNNPLGVKPRHLWLMGDNLENPRDLMRGGENSVLESLLFPSAYGHDQFGKSVRFNASNSERYNLANQTNWQSEGTTVAYFKPITTTANGYLCTAGPTNNRITITSGDNVSYRANAVTVAVTDAVVDNEKPYLFAGGYNGSEISVYCNTQYANSVTSDVPTSTGVLGIGAQFNGSFPVDGNIYWFAYFDDYLTEAQLRYLEDNPYCLFKPAQDWIIGSASTGGGSTEDDLLADDISSTSEVTSPSVGQEHSLTSTDVSSTSGVSSPVVGQEHGLTSTDIQATSELTSPALSESNILLADDIEVTSEVGSPSIGQTHALLNTSIQALSELTAPVIGQTHDLTSTNVESASELTAPTLSSAAFNLFADDIESFSETGTVTIGQTHNMLADDVQSLSELSSPTLGQTHALLSVSIQSTSEVTEPTVFIPSAENLLAEDIEALTEVSAPLLQQRTDFIEGKGAIIVETNGQYYAIKIGQSS